MPDGLSVFNFAPAIEIIGRAIGKISRFGQTRLPLCTQAGFARANSFGLGLANGCLP